MASPAPEQVKKAEAFRALHSQPEPLVLVNVWDIASARIIEELGFPALATTSAGIAFSKGFPDGQKFPPEQMISAVAEIAQSVQVPVTADAEAGYGSTPESAARTAREVILAGAVGMNFEDATGVVERPLADVSLQVERIRAIREAAIEVGVPLVLNARTDVYLLQVGDPGSRYEEAVKRLRAYREAGADCVFAPGIRDPETIGRLVSDLACPLNILAVPGSLSIPELAALRVKRISLGSGPMRAAMGLLRRLGQEVKAKGTYSNMEGAPSHAEMNQLMAAILKPKLRTEN
ncbi:MAG TPA: isocitrate lyase/phosphoenolpyruvate mutase family protein [Candidatus Sulfotelmatobacter sp.]|nr:isocitrate lyase/phosphoenolpyruvate mutase family protein [Candidatus Sulfotelmatobacter sp.]